MRRLLAILFLCAACREGAGSGHSSARPEEATSTIATASADPKASTLAASAPAPPMTFEQENDAWKAKRQVSLLKEDGWLTLVGLTWLREGSNEVKLPSNPPVTAHFELHGGKVTFRDPATNTLRQLRDDSDPQGAEVIQSGSFRYNVIRRNDRFAIRMKDSSSPSRTGFRGLDYFPADPKWRIEGRFERYDPPRTIAITNVLGMTSQEVAPGAIVFSVMGKSYRVEPILEKGETDLFLIFKDRTNGKETYGAARYLYARPPGPDGKVILDFNHAYNPPCAFTPYATCPLPPPQNRLPFRIEAGEKKYAGGHA